MVRAEIRERIYATVHAADTTGTSKPDVRQRMSEIMVELQIATLGDWETFDRLCEEYTYLKGAK